MKNVSEEFLNTNCHNGLMFEFVLDICISRLLRVEAKVSLFIFFLKIDEQFFVESRLNF